MQHLPGSVPNKRGRGQETGPANEKGRGPVGHERSGVRHQPRPVQRLRGLHQGMPPEEHHDDTETPLGEVTFFLPSFIGTYEK